MGRPAGSKNKSKEEESTIDTSEGGLATTSPSVSDTFHYGTPDGAPVVHEEEYVEPTVDTNIPSDPYATPAAAMLAIGRLYNDAGMLSAALSKHLPKVVGEPELFTFLQRMQNAIGDFRHMVEQVEGGISEELMSAIESAVA